MRRCSRGSRSRPPLSDPRWFDSHCHLHLCEDEAPLAQILSAARAAGVDDIVTIGIDATSSERAGAIARERSLYFSAGVHPNSANDWDAAAQTTVAQLLEEPRCVAVGETGLDFYRDAVDPAVQKSAFADHIELARDTDKALVIHTRSSATDALDILEASGPPARLVFHCWSGSPRDLERALGLGAYISFAGNVSFKNAEDLRDAARAVPVDRLLVETDAPFLAPVPHRGKTNQPAHVVHVGAAIAAARDEPIDAVAQNTTGNARALFDIS